MCNKASSILGEPLVEIKGHTVLQCKDIDHKPAYLLLPLDQPSFSQILTLDYRHGHVGTKHLIK